MFSVSDIESRLDNLRDQLKRAQVVTPDLISKVVIADCTRIAMQGGTTKATRVDRLIEAEAWTEVAVALVGLELPLWTVRRLVYQEGAWLCSLSKQWNLPVWLSDSIEARHESLPLAILSALIEARQSDDSQSGRTATSVPRCGAELPSPAEIMCCDNFA
jgi:hypothetical protein